MEHAPAVESVHEDLAAIEAALSEGRLAEFASLAAAIGESLDAEAVRAELLEAPEEARALGDRVTRLSGVVGYMRALQQALQGFSQPDDEVYGRTPAATGERRTAA